MATSVSLSSEEDETRSDEERAKGPVSIPVLRIGNSYTYTVPSFPVLSVQLKHIKYQMISQGTVGVFDGFMKECPSLERSYPAKAVITAHPDAFFIQEKEFSQSLGVNTLSFSKKQVFIIWKWAWEDEHVMESSSSPDLSSDPDELEEPTSEPNTLSCEDTPELETSKIKHSVVFKCVGVKKEKYIEKVLISASRKLDNGEDVPVRIRPEPDNPVDARAIAFECNVSGKWQRIGYIVQEAVEAVHDALERHLITDVKFDWIKYIVHWYCSGAGWYTGITITKQGEWPPVVVRSASTTFH